MDHPKWTTLISCHTPAGKRASSSFATRATCKLTKKEGDRIHPENARKSGTVNAMRKAAHPPGCARCGAGAGCSAIKYQSLSTTRTHHTNLHVSLTPSIRSGPSYEAHSTFACATLLLNVLLRHLQQAGISEEFISMDATTAFAVDLAAAVTTEQQGQKMVDICMEFADWAGMKLNHLKFVCSSWDFQTHASFPVTIEVNQKAIKVVENGGSIKILCVLISPKLDWTPQKAAVLRIRRKSP